METPQHMYQRCPHCESDRNLITMRFCGNCGNELGRACPRCGTTNFSDTSECAACGASLPRGCPKCHSLNLPAQQFCGTCGFPLLEEAVETTEDDGRQRPPRRERRKVSVLFVDIRGFTELSARMDTEEIYFLIDQALRRLASEVRRYGGSVDKFTGDGLMALFGAPEPLEQHALRAVGAAMSMQRVMQTYGEESQAKHNLDLRIRIGINSGEVVAGEVGADHFRAYTVIGDTVNLASRLEEAARPGHILVSESVYRATVANIEYAPAAPLVLKGYDEPVQAYEVLRLRQHAGSARGVPGLEAPLIGRDAEMEALKGLIPALENGLGGALFLVADAGTGKSRLLAEFIRQVNDAGLRPRRITGICSDHTRGIPYSLFTDLLTRYFELPFGQSSKRNREKVAETLRQTLPDRWQEVLPYITHLLSIGSVSGGGVADTLRNLSPEQVKQQMFHAVRTVLRAEAENRPLLLVCEDLHWSDDLSIELLQSLLYFFDDVPVLICCTSRPDANEQVSKLIDVARRLYADTHVSIELQPLTREHTERLLDELLDEPSLSEQLREDVIQYAEGIPLYLEELLRALIDADVIVQENDGWTATTDRSLDSIDVSQTLNEIVMARYSSLRPTLRNIVALASVIGRNVPYQLLEASLDQTTASPLLIQLERLEETRILQRRDAAPHLEYAFRNLITQQTIYDSLFSTDRQRLHLQVANAIEGLSSDDSNERVELLAYHLLRSSDEERALPYLIRAGEKAAGRFANKEAVQFYRQAKDLASRTSATDEQMIAIESGLGDVLTLTGNYDDARDAYTTALTFTQAHENGASSQVASLFRRIATTHLRQGNSDTALELLKTALDRLDPDIHADGNRREAARIYSEIGWVHYRHGELDDADTWLTSALDTVDEQDGQGSTSAGILNRLGGVAFQRGDLERAVNYTRKALQIREKLEQLNEIARSSANLAVLQSKRGSWTEAVDLYQRVKRSQEQIGDLEGLTLTRFNLGTLYTFMGDYESAEEELDRSLTTARKLSSPFLTAMALQGYARLHLAQSEWEAAEEALAESTQLAATASMPAAFRLLNLCLLSEVHAHRKDRDALRGTIDAAQMVVTEHEGLGSDVAFFHRMNGIYARLEAEWEQAWRELEQSYHFFDDDPFEQARTCVQLALVARDRGDRNGFERQLDEAEAVFRKLGARGELERIQELRTATASLTSDVGKASSGNGSP